MCKYVCFLVVTLFFTNLFAASNDAAYNSSSLGPKVFLDCGTCDFNYVRTHVRFVNYVRSRDEAQVQVLVTSMPTGSGGREFTLAFLGLKNFSGMDDTLHYESAPSESLDKIRSGLANTLALGLVRYAEQTPIAQFLSIDASKLGPPVESALKDRWNFWVFTLGANGYLNGQSLAKQNSWTGFVNVSRTTPESKFLLSTSAGYSESKYITNDQEVTAISRRQDLRLLGALSLDAHWSAGGILSAHSSTYDNEEAQLSLAPEVEYDFFPYSESTMRQLRFRYNVGYDYSRYFSETIFNKLSDNLTREELTVMLSLTQPWGSVNASLDGANYFYDFSKNHVQLYTQVSLSLSQGLSLNLSGAVSMIHDQLSLPQSGATTDQILLQQTELATQYSYWTAFGVSYTFGSIYNNVVNPRLW